MTEAAVLKSSGRLVGAVFVLAALAAGRPALAAASCEDPTFGNPALLVLSPVRLEIGDVNGDGKLDIVSIENGSIKVLFGNGDGTFAAPVSTPGPASPTASVLGQWNGDTLIDLAVASGVGSGSSITTFLGTTAGFGLELGSYAAGSTVGSLATADFDRNGTADALVVGSAADVYLLRGNGDGTFQSPLGTSLGPADVVRVGDFNGDLFPDLALLRRRLVNDVAISLNDGTGAFRPLLSPTNSFPDATQDFVTDDFDRDGRLDLAVISRAPGKALYVRLGNGNGTFGAFTSTTLATNIPELVVVGNFNGDAFPDVSVTEQGSVDFEILLGAGNGTFVSSLTKSLGGGSPTGEAAGDLNGDGLDDIVILFGGGIKVSLNTTGGGCASFVTATSTGGSGATSGQNVLQWMNPPGPGFTGLRIRYNTSATLACAPPADATSVGPSSIDLPFAAGRQTYLHTGLTVGTYYCYSLFAQTGASYSPPRSVTARPFLSTGRVKWGFATGAASLAPPGNGIGAVHVAANDSVVYAIKKGAGGGSWPDGPPAWTPRQLPGPSQGRPSTVGLPVGAAAQVLFLGAQDGHAYALDAQRGNLAWRSPLLGSMVQAAPSGMFVAFGGNHDYVLVGSRNPTGVPNAFYALRLSDGTVAWTFGGEGHSIGAINSQATVDYANRRVYFASLAFGAAAPDNDTVWCVNLDTGLKVWSAAVGNVVGSVIVRNGRAYVGSGVAATGEIHALDAASGLSVWGVAGPTFSTGADGPVKSYVGSDRLSPTGRLLFSTSDKLWAIDDLPASTAAPAAAVWVRDGSATSSEPAASRIPNPSAPAFLAGGPWIFVGSSNGKVYRLDYATGSAATQLAIPLGDPVTQAPVGSPTVDVREGFLYVGTAAGVVYAVQLP